MLLAIVGMAGSGKSVLAEHFTGDGIPVVRFGEFILKEVERRGLALTPANEQEVREDLRRSGGMNVCAMLALPQLKDLASHHKVVVIDGLYSFSEYKTLRREFGDELVLLAVFTPRALRYERLSVRPFRPLSRSEAEARDYREIEAIEKGGPIAIADFTLVNNGPPSDLIAKAQTVVEEALRSIKA